MKYQMIPVTAFAQNCTLLWCENTRQAAVVDPGGDLDKVLAVTERGQLQLTKILLHNAHIDHAGAVAELDAKLGLPIEGPQRSDKSWIDLLPQHSATFGFPAAQRSTPDRCLEQGDQVQ